MPVRFRIGLAVLCASLLIDNGAARGQDAGPGAVKDLIKAIEANRAKIQTARVLVVGTCTDQKGALTLPSVAAVSMNLPEASYKADNPSKDTTNDFQAELLVDIASGRHRSNVTEMIWSPEGQKYSLTSMKSYCDGSHFASQYNKDSILNSPSSNWPSVHFLEANTSSYVIHRTQWPIMFALGCMDTRLHVSPGKNSPIRSDLTLEGTKVVSDQRPNGPVVFEWHYADSEEGHLRIEADPTAGYRFTSVQSFDGKGHLRSRADMDYSAGLKGWLPRRWTLKSFSHDSGEQKLLSTVQAEVKECEVNPAVAVEDFQPVLKPKTTIWDHRTKDKSKEFLKVAENGALEPYTPTRKQ